ncbi:MAG TPA: hypothetical protein VF657_03975 [Actinoplanes sp.]|jgi:hypothetical protein
MSSRSVARWCALPGLVAALGFIAPVPSQAASAGELPTCKPRAASSSRPSGPPKVSAPRACRVKDTRPPESSALARRTRESTTTDGNTLSGYTHLGAGTAREWGGVSGRIAVTNGTVRRNTYDFVAGRFMVKQDQGEGRIAWLEAGWAETGWSGAGRQRIYTYDTNTRGWRFHDQYDLRPGDRIWLDLRAGGDGTWQAWLWWDDRWNLLSSERLPLGRTAHVEQYVELYVDPRKPARVTVPPVTVDNVRLLPAGSNGGRFWREDVDTVTGDDDARERRGPFCLDWITRFDTWSAGNCTTR